MTFMLKIALGNESMLTTGEAMAAAMESVNRFGSEGWGTSKTAEIGDGAAIFDRNGNRVGHWTVAP